MTARACFEIHGAGLAVVADAPAVIDALALRLAPFAAPADVTPDLTFEFASGTRLARPPGPGRPFYETPFGALEYHDGADAVWGELDGVDLVCEPGAGRARFASAAFEGETLYLATHPLTTICLMEIFKRRGLYALHAGCLTTPGGTGVLIAGPSGAGKSTLTMALARAGMAFLSDDVVFLSVSTDNVEALAFPDALGVTAGTATFFPELARGAAYAAADGFPKQLVRVEDVWNVEMPTSCEPRALLFPEIVSGTGSLLPLEGREALLRLVPDVLLTQPAGSQSHLRALAELLDQVDCFRIRCGRDLAANAELVTGLLARIRTSSPAA